MRLLIYSCLLFLLFSMDVQAAIRYLDPANGRDTNAGTQAAPWKTLNKVVESAIAGDTIYVRGGTYPKSQFYDPAKTTSGYLIWSNTKALGTSAAPITIQSAPNERAVFDGSGTSYFLYFYGSPTYAGHFVIVRGLDFKNFQGIALRTDNDAKYVAIEDCAFSNFTDQATGAVQLGNAKFITVRNSTFKNMGVADKLMHAIYPSEGLENVLIDNNYIQGGPGFGIHAYGHYDNSKTTRNFIIRRNTILNFRGANINVSSTNFVDVYVYHNTMFATHNPYPSRDALDSGRALDLRDGSLTNLQFQNNIGYGPFSDSTVYSPNPGFYLPPHGRDYNLWVNQNGSRVLSWNNAFYTLANFKSVAGLELHSISVDPLFKNAAQFDFTLSAGSPAIDSGTVLTTTVAAGSGTQIKVRDAGYFFDGFGLLAGDQIQVGSQLVKVTRADYAQDILTIDRSISWSAGAGVSLPYNGTAPDMGAHESGTNTSTRPAAPKNLKLL